MRDWSKRMKLFFSKWFKKKEKDLKLIEEEQSRKNIDFIREEEQNNPELRKKEEEKEH